MVVQDDHFETLPLANICPGDWFMSLDLKDMYFHIQVAPHHRQILRFAFKGVAYQYKVLPFGLSLAPRTFMRCMDVALSPLRQMGVHILNYIDNWLILAQSEAVSTSHKTLLLSHLGRLGLRVNFAKSIRSPSQRVSFRSNGASHDNSAPRGFLRERYWPSAQSFPENAGPYGSGFAGTSVGSASHATHPVLAKAEGSIRGLASRTPPRNGDSACVSALAHWREILWLKQGVILYTAHRRKVVMTYASNKGWGALCEGKLTFGLWSEEESGLHINCLEMLAVCRTILPARHTGTPCASTFKQQVINNQDGLVSERLCMLANNFFVWAQTNLCSLKATHFPGKMNQGADMFSWNNISHQRNGRSIRSRFRKIGKSLAELE